MVGVKKLNEMRMNPCRGVVNNFSIVKIIRIQRSCETENSKRNSIIGCSAIGIKRAGALLTAQTWNRRNFFCGVKEERRNPPKAESQRVPIHKRSGGLTRSSEGYLREVFGNLDLAKGLARPIRKRFLQLYGG